MTMAGASLCAGQNQEKDSLNIKSEKSEKFYYDFPLNSRTTIKARYGDLNDSIFAVSERQGSFVINYKAIVTAKDDPSAVIHNFGTNLKYSRGNNTLLTLVQSEQIDDFIKNGWGLIIYNDDRKYEEASEQKIAWVLENRPMTEAEDAIFTVEPLLKNVPNTCHSPQCPMKLIPKK